MRTRALIAVVAGICVLALALVFLGPYVLGRPDEGPTDQAGQIDLSAYEESIKTQLSLLKQGEKDYFQRLTKIQADLCTADGRKAAVRLLGQPSLEPTERHVIARSLAGREGTLDVLRELLHLLEAQDAEVRLAAAAAISTPMKERPELKTPSGTTVMTVRAPLTDKEARAKLRGLLERETDSRVKAALVETLASSIEIDPQVEKACRELALDSQAAEMVRASAVGALVRYGEVGVLQEVIPSVLSGDNSELVRCAALSCRPDRVADARITAALTSTLATDESESARIGALRLLIHAQSPEARAAMLTALKGDPAPEVRVDCAWCLAFLPKDTSVLQALQAAASNDPSEMVRQAARHSLAVLSEE